MSEFDLREAAPGIVVIITVSVASVAMLITMQLRKTEPQVVREAFHQDAPAAPEIAPPEEADEPPLVITPKTAPPTGGARPSGAPAAPVKRTPSAAVSAPARRAAPPAGEAEARPAGYQAMVTRERDRAQGIWNRYLAKSATARAYVQEWHSTPELVALQNRWDKDHDPMAFLKGIAGQPKFFQLLGKYGHSPELTPLVKEMVAGASPEAMGLATKALSSDAVIQQLMKNSSKAVGLPLGSFGGKQQNPDEMLKTMLNTP